MVRDLRRQLAKLHWVPFLFVLTISTPPEVGILVGPLRISSYRLVLLGGLLFCALRSTSGNARQSFSGTDKFMLFHGAWTALALLKYSGLVQGVESAGAYMLETTGSYWIGRTFIRSDRDFRALAALLVIVVFLLLGFAALESVSGNHLLRDCARAVFGGPPLILQAPRWGLHRAYATFDHPILFGVFCASSFAPAIYLLAKRGNLFRSSVAPVLATVATFFSLSAGAFLALAVQVGLGAWEWLTRGFRHRWLALLGIFACFWVGLSLVSNRSPVRVFLSYMTFSHAASYNRLTIWEYGSREVWRHPVFGIGLGDWERPAWLFTDSMDNFWLATAVRYGLPAFLSLSGGLLLLCVRLGTNRRLGKELAAHRQAWFMMITGWILAGCTVHFWNATLAIFFFLIGAATWMTTARSTKSVSNRIVILR